MANNQIKANNKYRRLDFNSNSYHHMNNINSSSDGVTINRLVSKFGDMMSTTKHMRNLQNINLSLGFKNANKLIDLQLGSPNDPFWPGAEKVTQPEPTNQLFPAENLKSPLSDNIYSLSEQIDFLNSTSSYDENEDAITNSSLVQSIENALNEAKQPSADNNIGSDPGELIIPNEMSLRVANDIVRMAEDEPCGLKGCIIYVNYEDKCNNRRLSKLRCDPTSVPTFEVTLTLRQDSSWLRGLLPIKGCWKKLKNKAVVISSVYSITKNKLYLSESPN